MVLSKCYWIMSYVPFIPATPVQLWISIWVLLPQNEGEKVMYLVLSSYFAKFEEKITVLRNGFFIIVLKIVLSLAFHATAYCCTRIDPQKLANLREVSESTDNIIYQQMKRFGVQGSKSSSRSSASEP